MEYVFSYDDLHILPSKQASLFDEALRDKWQAAMDAGHFKYSLEGTQTRVMPGKRGYVITHNKKRFVERRRAILFSSMDQPFNHDKFNFTKVLPDEVILQLRFADEKANEKEIDCPILINVSPLGFGHVLLVPQRMDCLNQVLTEDALKASLRTLLLSNSRNFYFGYNSLLAHATVNHLHLHGWYTDHPLLCSIADFNPLLVDKNLYKFSDHPVKGFVFIMNEVSDIDRISRLVSTLTGHLHSKRVAHNLTICRGFHPGSDKSRDVVRICIWPRTYSTIDDKGENRYNVAVAEISGFIVCRESEDFHSLDEATLNSDLQEANLPENEFHDLEESVLTCLRAL